MNRSSVHLLCADVADESSFEVPLSARHGFLAAPEVPLKYNPGKSQKTLLKAAGRGDEDTVNACLDALASQTWGPQWQWGRHEYWLDLNELNREDRNTPLIQSASNGHAKIVKILLEKTADPNLQDRILQTALHKAAANGHDKAVEALLQSRADATLQDVTMRTPLDLAEIGMHARCVQLLRTKRTSRSMSMKKKENTSASDHGWVNYRASMGEQLPRQRLVRKHHLYGYEHQHGKVAPLSRIFDKFDETHMSRSWSRCGGARR